MGKQIQSELEDNGILMLGQGIDGSRKAVSERFTEVEDVVLMGTQSFWEGVDFLGTNMKSLILVKLPFPVPSEPIIEAQIELLEKEGRNSFSDLMIPQAVTKFKQGFGRLIRSKEDSGIILVLDKRIVKNHYGKKFLGSLPVSHITAQDEKELISKMQSWK